MPTADWNFNTFAGRRDVTPPQHLIYSLLSVSSLTQSLIINLKVRINFRRGYFYLFPIFFTQLKITLLSYSEEKYFNMPIIESVVAVYACTVSWVGI